MSNEVKNVIRHLPPRWVEHMTHLEACGFLELDGRSQHWVDELAELDFVKREFTEYNKHKITITVELTDRGRYALERDRRGVDPYLVMT